MEKLVKRKKQANKPQKKYYLEQESVPLTEYCYQFIPLSILKLYVPNGMIMF